MKVNNKKAFVPDFSESITSTSGKGTVKLEATPASYLIGNPGNIPEPYLLTNVRFNLFQSRLGSTHFIDRKSSSTDISFQRGIPDENHKSIESGGALTTRDLYPEGALTHTNFAGSNVKMKTEYVQRALSLGSKYLPVRTFVKMENASSLALQNNGYLTFMLRVMIDSSRVGDSSSTPEDKALLSIGVDAVTSYQINVSGRQGVGDGVKLTSKVRYSSADGNVSTAASTLQADRWYTVFFNIYQRTNEDVRHQIRAYEMSGVNAGNLVTSTGLQLGSPSGQVQTLTGQPSLVIGYGEDSGGRNVEFTTEDFIQGVHLAEFAAWDSFLSNETMDQIAASHLPRNQYESGIDSRPVRRVQQIFDSMDSYPRQRKTTGKRLKSEQVAYNTINEENFGAVHKEPMVYPEMIPARLYSGSGGTWYNGSYFPYASTGSANRHPTAPIQRIPLKENQFRDIRGTAFENRLVTTGAVYPGIAHKETLNLNKISVAGYERTQSLTGSTIAALGGLISPFNDDRGGDAAVINEIATSENVYPGLDQKLGDIIAIEIPIPTLQDAIMGVDATQGRIASMAYYNFMNKKWDRKFMPGISGSNIRSSYYLSGEGIPGGTTSFWEDARQFLLNSCSIGFGGTSGFSIFTDEGNSALMDLPTRGRPTSMYGFPQTTQYEASTGQALSISDYIDAPFLLQKIAIEFDAEVEESGPASIATTIVTPSRWKAASQDYMIRYSGGGTEYLKSVRTGIPGAKMFYRSVDASHSDYASVDNPNAIVWEKSSRHWNAPRFALALEDAGTYGNDIVQAMMNQSFMNPYPTFVGGSSKPAYADFMDVYNSIERAGGTGENNYNWKWMQFSGSTGWPNGVRFKSKGFPNSADRMFSIQDTSNDLASYGGAGWNIRRGSVNEAFEDNGSGLPRPISPETVHDIFPGAPDFLSSVTGYYSSQPSTAMFFNIPAGIFLPQIERAPSTNINIARGRQDGVPIGGMVKLLFGGISGMVTGSYTPGGAGTVNEFTSSMNYYSSGSTPHDAEYVNRWDKQTFLSRNYISFVDSFMIDDKGLMTPTTNTKYNADPKGAAMNNALGNVNSAKAKETYPAKTVPTATGGAPFWRCDTFFLLHQKKGKIRFVGGEADVTTATEKQSFEKLEGATAGLIQGRTNGNATGGDADNINDQYIYQNGAGSRTKGSPHALPDLTHQSAVLASSYADGLGQWFTTDTFVMQEHRGTTPIFKRSNRIKIEETPEEFNQSARTTHRELITYAQITHYGYAASNAVTPGAVIPSENYYVSPSAAEGRQPTKGRQFEGTAGTGVDVNGQLLPCSRSFYTQAIKLGATNVPWTNVTKRISRRFGGVDERSGQSLWRSLGAGSRSKWNSRTRLYGSPGNGGDKGYYASTGSDQYRTAYMRGYKNTVAENATPSGLPGAGVWDGATRGIIGDLTTSGTSGPDASNPMFKDPGAGSGNGMFWRFSEIDQVGDYDWGAAGWRSGKPFMRAYKWTQWFENPVYGGLANQLIDTSFSPPFLHPFVVVGNNNTGNAGLSVPVGTVPIALKWDSTAGSLNSGSFTGGKLNYQQIDWRYQCGTHYNSAMDVAPIALTSGPRYRTGEVDSDWTSLAVPNRPSTKATSPWYNVGGHSPTGSDFIGSMVSSASQPWHGTAITRAGFSIITSPTTLVPSGSHPDYTSYGGFHTPGMLKTQGGIGGNCNVDMPLFRTPDVPIASTTAWKISPWLNAGLSRDLDIECGWKFKHKRTDINNGIASFTILTASTVFPPGDLAGRFNGDHKLRATVKEKRLLNASSFRVVSDVKTQPPSALDSSGLFCLTAPAQRAFLVGTGSARTEGDFAASNIGTSRFQQQFGDNSRFSNDRIWWRAYSTKNQYLGNTEASNWQTLIGTQPSIASARRYVAAIGGMRPRIDEKSFLTSGSSEELRRQQIPQFAPGPGIFRAAYIPSTAGFNSSFAQPFTGGPAAGRQLPRNTANDNQPLGSIQIQGLFSPSPTGLSAVEWTNSYVPYVSASLADDKPQTSLYLLMPGDEIVLGFQPSLHGENRGNNTIPMNPNVNPYGPWRDGIVDRQGIPTGSAYNPEYNYGTSTARPEMVDSKGQGGYHLRRGPNKLVEIMKDNGTSYSPQRYRSVNNANMETLYEPGSSFTIKKSSGAKLILYGTLLRDKKHVAPPSAQELRSNAVHEAIMGAPIVDQYQIEPTHAYTGSYIAHHITGSIFEHQKNAKAMGIPPRASSANFGPGYLPKIGSLYDPNSPSFIQFGGPSALLSKFRRGVLRIGAYANAKLPQGLQTTYPGTTTSIASTSEHWPIAPANAIFSMGISGSVQRFVRLADDSEFYYDSMPPHPIEMVDIDLQTSASNTPDARAFDRVTSAQVFTDGTGGKFGIINWGHSSRFYNNSPFGINTTVRTPQEIQYSYPFENKYRNVARLVNPTVTLNTTASFWWAATGDYGQTNLDANDRDPTSWHHQPSGVISTMRIARPDHYNDMSFMNVNEFAPHLGVGIDRNLNPRGSRNILVVTIAGFWKTKWGQNKIYPTLGYGYQNHPDTTDVAPRDGCQIDHPSGWKYGLCNYTKTASSAVFRMDRYGQLRDMLEQRKYTRFYDTGDQFNPPGLQESAVTCIFVDGDGLPIDDPLQTTCLNVSNAMTSSIPYKEGETQRTFLFNAELVTISPLVQSFAASPFLSLPTGRLS